MEHKLNKRKDILVLHPTDHEQMQDALGALVLVGCVDVAKRIPTTGMAGCILACDKACAASWSKDSCLEKCFGAAAAAPSCSEATKTVSAGEPLVMGGTK